MTADLDSYFIFSEEGKIIPTEKGRELMRENWGEEWDDDMFETEAQQKNAKAKIKVKNLAVPVYRQQTGYWCAPASCKEVQQYLRKKSASQKLWAKRLKTTKKGTAIANIPRPLTKYTNKKYILVSVNNYKRWKKNIWSGISKKIPAILSIRVTEEQKREWEYSTSGHFLPTSGAVLKNGLISKVRMADPHPTHYGQKRRKVRLTHQVCKQAVIDRKSVV